MNKATLENLINQLPKPYFLCGDFNAHNIIWGSKNTDQRGKMLEEILEDLTLLNDYSPTHFCARSGNFSNIDLTFCDPRITPDLTWNVINCLYTSDHFPIQINHILTDQTTPPPHSETWNIKKIDWELYKSLMTTSYPSITSNTDINVLTENFTSKITHAAKTAIGIKKLNQRKHTTCWWNEDCEKVIKENIAALYQYKKNKTMENLIELKRARAKCRRIIRPSKKTSWQNYVKTMTADTPTKEIWNKIQRIKGRNPSTSTSTIIHNNIITNNPQQITSILAESFEKNSSDDNYDPQFLQTKNQAENEKIQISANNNIPINEPFNKHEIDSTIKELKCNTSPGPDNISTEMIKKST